MTEYVNFVHGKKSVAVLTIAAQQRRRPLLTMNSDTVPLLVEETRAVGLVKNMSRVEVTCEFRVKGGMSPFTRVRDISRFDGGLLSGSFLELRFLSHGLHLGGGDASRVSRLHLWVEVASTLSGGGWFSVFGKKSNIGEHHHRCCSLSCPLSYWKREQLMYGLTSGLDCRSRIVWDVMAFLGEREIVRTPWKGCRSRSIAASMSVWLSDAWVSTGKEAFGIDADRVRPQARDGLETALFKLDANPLPWSTRNPYHCYQPIGKQRSQDPRTSLEYISTILDSLASRNTRLSRKELQEGWLKLAHCTICVISIAQEEAQYSMKPNISIQIRRFRLAGVYVHEACVKYKTMTNMWSPILYSDLSKDTETDFLEELLTE